MIPIQREPSHPGEVLLEEFLKPLNIAQSSFATAAGWTPARLNEIVNGKRGITPEAALVLSKITETSPEFWLNLQSGHDLWKAKQKQPKSYIKITIQQLASSSPRQKTTLKKESALVARSKNQLQG